MDNKKILVLDIDGTLVNSQKEITPKTLESLIKIQEEGHIVALASGRPYPGMEKYAKEIGLDRYHGYALSFNGGRIVDCATGETVFEKCIPKKYAPIIYRYAMEKGIGMVTYQDNCVITGTPIDEYMEYEARLNTLIIHQVEDFEAYVDFDMVKCLLTAPPDIAPVYEQELKELLGEELNVFRSEPYFIEITIKGVDKAESLEGFLPKIGLTREDSICCGDGFNDLTMVKYGGVGVAMGNAQQIVKDNADYITASCDEDGLIEVIDKFVRDVHE
ncbi:MAG: HAD family phosphatase [Lachnospiraceae bacterium]|nr:HAD family phosphatase [Lachnospiraceae bacterium]